MRKAPPFTLLLFFLLQLIPSSLSHNKHGQVYIVYLGEHGGTKNAEEIRENHHSLLHRVKNSEEDARRSLLYSYKNSINGFAAVLSEEEAAALSGMGEVVCTFPSEGRWSSPHTTRSWEFIGHEEGTLKSQKGIEPLRSKAEDGKDVIIGMLDSGIWPESKSFSDEGMGPVPKKWKGICQEGDSFNSSNCNKITRKNANQRKNANLGSEIKQREKDNKAKLERMERKNANLEAEITILKRKIAALDVKSANSRGMELSATCLTSQLILLEPNDIISPMEMEHQEGSNSSDELAAGMIILIFLISVLIGMQIPTFT